MGNFDPFMLFAAMGAAVMLGYVIGKTKKKEVLSFFKKEEGSESSEPTANTESKD